MLLLLLVSGCASTQEYRAQPATLEYVTAKTPAAVRDCVQDRLAGYALVEAPKINPRGDGYVFLWSDPRIFVDVTPETAGTRVALHHHGFVFRKEITASVKSCT